MAEYHYYVSSLNLRVTIYQHAMVAPHQSSYSHSEGQAEVFNLFLGNH